MWGGGGGGGGGGGAILGIVRNCKQILEPSVFFVS